MLKINNLPPPPHTPRTHVTPSHNKAVREARRSSHVDFVKGYAIMAVVFYHISSKHIPIEYANDIMGSSWSVASFFLVSGFFIKYDGLDKGKQFLWKRIKRLYIPTCILYILAILFHNLFLDLDLYKLGEMNYGNNTLFEYYNIKDIIYRIALVPLCMGKGEQVMGAMWFAYSLLICSICFLGLWYFSKWISHYLRLEPKWIFPIILLIVQFCSCYITKILGITIPRISNSLSAMMLIYVGMLMNQIIKMKYDNEYILIVSLIILLQGVVFGNHISMISNKYDDILQLLGESFSAVYILAFIGKKVENNWFGKIVSYIGRYSFEIMALHVIGLLIGNNVVEVITTFTERGQNTYIIDYRYDLLIMYMFLGLSVPLLLRRLYDFTMSCFKSRKLFFDKLYKQHI